MPPATAAAGPNARIAAASGAGAGLTAAGDGKCQEGWQTMVLAKGLAHPCLQTQPRQSTWNLELKCARSSPCVCCLLCSQPQRLYQHRVHLSALGQVSGACSRSISAMIQIYICISGLARHPHTPCVGLWVRGRYVRPIHTCTSFDPYNALLLRLCRWIAKASYGRGLGFTATAKTVIVRQPFLPVLSMPSSTAFAGATVAPKVRAGTSAQCTTTDCFYHLGCFTRRDWTGNFTTGAMQPDPDNPKWTTNGQFTPRRCALAAKKAGESIFGLTVSECSGIGCGARLLDPTPHPGAGQQMCCLVPLAALAGCNLPRNPRHTANELQFARRTGNIVGLAATWPSSQRHRKAPLTAASLHAPMTKANATVAAPLPSLSTLCCEPTSRCEVGAPCRLRKACTVSATCRHLLYPDACPS